MPKRRNKIVEVTTLDKYEYKVRADEIKALIAEGEYAKAAEIADTIDWRRVKSVMMLCTISDLYKINRRYEDSRDILLLAYEKHPGGRLIVYSLCELSIKLEEYVQAIEYYKEFVQLAPKDSGRYVLQYKLYEAQEVSLEERIAVLEELKNKEYREKWAYELAYLYHRVGLETKCVEECDEMYLWFGEGRYVMKALELKQLHQPLSEDQKRAYTKMREDIMGVSDPTGEGENIKQEATQASVEEDDNEFSREVTVLTDPTQKMPPKEELDEIQVKTVDVSQYNTINLQKELAESMREFLENNQTVEIPAEQVADALGETKVIGPVNVDGMQEIVTEEMPVEEVAETFEAKTADAELQEEAPAAEEYKKRSITEEIFFGDTSEVTVEDVLLELEEQDAKAKEESAAAGAAMADAVTVGATVSSVTAASAAAASATSAMINTGVIRAFNKPSGYDNILSQDSDGQISLVVPEQEKVEKQITGQLSIDDIMAEWEKIKKENEQKRMADIRERVQQHTGSLFASFDESAKTGLLEELEKSMADEDKPRVIKVSDIEKLDAEAAFAAGLTDELPVEEVEEVIEEIVEDVVEDVADDVAEDVENVEEADAVEEAVETVEDVAEEAIEEAEPEISEETVEETAEDVSEEVSEDEVPEVTEELAEEAAEAVEHETAEEAVAETGIEDQVAKEEKADEEDAPAEKSETGGKYQARELTKQESELFAPFIHHRRTRRQIADTIDHISMASYTGNVIITGEESTGNLGLAKLLVKEVQMTDNNFSGKVAKISASTLNNKDVAATLDKLEGGALIVEGASALSAEVVSSLLKEMNREDKGLIILMEDRKPLMNEFLAKNEEMQTLFNLRVDVEALDDQTLVKYAKKYAYEQEYVIDEVAVLALHKRIADMQTSDHEVTMAEIEELVDEAIYYADRKTPKHFFDILLGKRYDEEDMIILREADFMHD